MGLSVRQPVTCSVGVIIGMKLHYGQLKGKCSGCLGIHSEDSCSSLLLPILLFFPLLFFNQRYGFVVMEVWRSCWHSRQKMNFSPWPLIDSIQGLQLYPKTPVCCSFSHPLCLTSGVSGEAGRDRERERETERYRRKRTIEKEKRWWHFLNVFLIYLVLKQDTSKKLSIFGDTISMKPI